MNNDTTAYCSICGRGYHVCDSCAEQKKLKPWRTVTDTIGCYKIYLLIYGYTISKDKEKAKQELQNCDLSGLENFNPEIKSVIGKIMEESKVKSIPKLKKEKQGNLPGADVNIENN